MTHFRIHFTSTSNMWHHLSPTQHQRLSNKTFSLFYEVYTVRLLTTGSSTQTIYKYNPLTTSVPSYVPSSRREQIEAHSARNQMK